MKRIHRMHLYFVFFLALLLKASGASWDASYHFRYFRETTQLPHLLNISGQLLFVETILFLWKKEFRKDKRSLLVMFWGLLALFAGIPLDEIWHRLFGIDLTTWSPTHLTLDVASFVALVGVLLLVIHDYEKKIISRKVRTIALVVLFMFALDNVWYPMMQQEQAVIAYPMYLAGKLRVAPDMWKLLQVRNVHDLMYGGAPEWFYAAYVCFVSAFVFRTVKHLKIAPYSCTAVAALYLLYRTAMNGIFLVTDYQTSAVPYYLLAIAFLFDIISNIKHIKEWIVVFVLTSSIVGILFFVSLIIDHRVHPPISLDFPTYGLWFALVGYLLGDLLTKELVRKTTGFDKLLEASTSHLPGHLMKQ